MSYLTFLVSFLRLLIRFRQAFDLLEFDIQELEESLLLMGSEDDSSQLVQRLVIKLLKGCSNTFTKNITEDVRDFLNQEPFFLINSFSQSRILTRT